MTDNPVYISLVLLTLVIALMLMFISLTAFGKQFGLYQYQKALHANKVRILQSAINLRIHFDRTFLSLVFITGVILVFVDFDMEIKIWINRIMYLMMLGIFFISSLLDWLTDEKQMQLVMASPSNEGLAAMRLHVHDMANTLQMADNYIQYINEKDTNVEKATHYMDELRVQMAVLQQMLREKDPTYENSKRDASGG